MRSTIIFGSAIFSASLKFGTCYITGQRSYFWMKTATLWCLIDIPTLINFSKYFELGHSSSTPIFSQPVYSTLPANWIFAIFPNPLNVPSPPPPHPPSTRHQRILYAFIYFFGIFLFLIIIIIIITNKKKESMIKNCQWSYL